tara:strand:- start:265 stop:1674 length:1410 start_codon:yes stop_codon:yes gene_type:complete
MATSQKYILDSNDEIKPSIVTSDNKNNLISGGLFDGLTLEDSSNRDSANIEARDLIKESGTVSLDWQTLKLQGGDWNATSNFEVSGDLDVGGSIDVIGNVTASDFSGNFHGNFSGDFDLSSVGESSANDLFNAANLNTDDIPEGSVNHYYTDDKFKDSINSVLNIQSPLTGSYEGGEYKIELDTIAGLVTTGNALHVNNNSGTDDRTGLSAYDFAESFATIGAAKTAAQAGDTIIVWPGTYEDEADLLKPGVDYFFLPGTTVIQTASHAGVEIFRDTSATTANVLGYGKFITSSTTIKTVVSITNSASKVRIEADLIQSTSADGGNNVITHTAGALEVACRQILSSGLGIRTNSDTLIVKNSYVKALLGSAIETKGVTVTCLIDNCQLESEHADNESGAIFVEPNSSGCRVKNCILRTASNYSIVTTTGSTAVVSILSGVTANKQLYEGVTAEALAPFTIDETFNLTIF